MNKKQPLISVLNLVYVQLLATEVKQDSIPYAFLRILQKSKNDSDETIVGGCF